MLKKHFNIQDLLYIQKTIQPIDENKCVITATKIMKEIYPQNEFLIRIYNGPIYVNDIKFIINKISDTLDTHNVCWLHIYENDPNSDCHHNLVLFKTYDSTFKIDSYHNLYSPRLVEWETYKSDLETLLSYDPKYSGRIDFWNGLFSAKVRSYVQKELNVEIIIGN